jgi:vacuolar-type H+-ATPase subunit E/Vma4
MEQAEHGHNYRQLADEIGEVLQAAAETAEKMQEKARAEADRMEEQARAEADRIRAEAEEQLRSACTEARRIVDEARMESDMVRAEADWQAQEIVAQARSRAAGHLAAAETRLAEVEKVERGVLDRLAGVGQMVTDALASLRTGAAESAALTVDGTDPEVPVDDGDAPTAKVYFVEFPPVTAAEAPADDEAGIGADPDDGPEVVLSEDAGASLFNDDQERSEWAPPTTELPTWWTRGGAG